MSKHGLPNDVYPFFNTQDPGTLVARHKGNVKEYAKAQIVFELRVRRMLRFVRENVASGTNPKDSRKALRLTTALLRRLEPADRDGDWERSNAKIAAREVLQAFRLVCIISDDSSHAGHARPHQKEHNICFMLRRLRDRQRTAWLYTRPQYTRRSRWSNHRFPRTTRTITRHAHPLALLINTQGEAAALLRRGCDPRRC